MTEATGALAAGNDNCPVGPLRPPEMVMRLDRLGAAFPTRLSFMRTLVRTLARAPAVITRPVWQIDDQGYGRAVYSVSAFGDIVSLVAFSTPLADEARTDRVIAEAWDTSYVLYDGIPGHAELARLEAHAPRQEAGRFTERDLVLSRANKSVRLFAHVTDCLAAGRQPDRDVIGPVGYLMRTTAVYGNGKFGIADRARVRGRPLIAGPFRAEMLTVWLIRAFTHDLVEHVARQRAPATAVPLDREIRRYLGIGNATGLGMAPFLVSHPRLLHNWILARETAIARVRALPAASAEARTQILRLLDRAQRHLAEWTVDEARQKNRITVLRQELRELAPRIEAGLTADAFPFDRMIALAEDRSLECQELLAALLLEPNGDVIDDLETMMGDEATDRLDPAMTLGELGELIETHWVFALDLDFAEPAATEQFWYVSEEKLEPRLGRRRDEPGADREMPLDIARRVHALAGAMAEVSPAQTVAEFLLAQPEHRYAVRRVQSSQKYPYGEIRDNLIGAGCMPIDMLRAKLAFFGAAKFDPRSTLWTRITMYQGAPLIDEIEAPDADDWWLPAMDRQALREHS